MTRHTHAPVVDGPLTYEALIALWQSYDEPLSSEELEERWHPSTPGALVLARCVLAVVILTVLVGLPPLLRAFGQ